MRRVQYESFLRHDGLWDLEGTLLDTKAIDTEKRNGTGLRKAGEPIHLMRIRLTFDEDLIVRGIEAVMEDHPFGSCPEALNAMQGMVGASMAQGWRHAIKTHLGKINGCAHMRELLQGMATAAFQSIVPAFAETQDQPPVYLAQCTAWRLDGPAVAEHFPQFFTGEGRKNPAEV